MVVAPKQRPSFLVAGAIIFFDLGILGNARVQVTGYREDLSGPCSKACRPRSSARRRHWHWQSAPPVRIGNQRYHEVASRHQSIVS